MNCPHCGEELSYIDKYGKYLGDNNWLNVGEIYQCDNLDCESGLFDFFFYTYEGIEGLLEGYPC